MSDQEQEPKPEAAPATDEKAAQEWASLSQLASSLPKIKNYSTAKDVAVGLLGPTVRIWRRNNVITVGYEKDGSKYVLGEGVDYTSALRLVAFTLANAAAKAAKQKHEEEKAVTEGGQEQG